MTREQLAELHNFNTGAPSAYEEKYVRWGSITYDKECLSEFLREVSRLEQSEDSKIPQTKDSVLLEILYDIAEELDFEFLKDFLRGDENVTRLCTIEKFARRGAAEILTSGVYSTQTLQDITNLPLADYMLIVKRTQELVQTIENISSNAGSLSAGLPGR